MRRVGRHRVEVDFIDSDGKRLSAAVRLLFHTADSIGRNSGTIQCIARAMVANNRAIEKADDMKRPFETELNNAAAP